LTGAFTPTTGKADSCAGWKRSMAPFPQPGVENIPRFARLVFLRKTVNSETNTLKLRCSLHNKTKLTGRKKEKQDRCSLMARQNYIYKFPATASQSSKS